MKPPLSRIAQRRHQQSGHPDLDGDTVTGRTITHHERLLGTSSEQLQSQPEYRRIRLLNSVLIGQYESVDRTEQPRLLEHWPDIEMNIAQHTDPAILLDERSEGLGGIDSENVVRRIGIHREQRISEFVIQTSIREHRIVGLPMPLGTDVPQRRLQTIGLTGSPANIP